MPNILHSFSDAYETYRKWVSANPQTVGDLETTLKWASYFVAGRMSNSPVITELTYSLSNLLVLFNDQIIAQSLHKTNVHHRTTATNASTTTTSTTSASTHSQHERNSRRLKLLLTTLEYCEVFIEMSARQLWGEHGRWFFVCALQLCKCVFRMLLTVRYREPIVQTPATKALNRKDVGEQQRQEAADADDPTVDGAFGANVNASFELRRSGKIVRSVEGAPPIHLRTWRAPERRLTAAERLQAKSGHRVTMAECVYIFKPLVHLGACGAFGLNSWRSYGVPLLMDLYSLHLYNRQRSRLSAHQRIELSRRHVQMLMYLVRSPVYDRITKERIAALIAAVGRTVPLTSTICAALNDYIPHWQSIYFYMWSS